MGLVRLILAISVVVAHTGPLFGVFPLIGGEVAVEAFYIISGFYMALILNEKYIGAGYYKLFITNRMLKIFPLYWTILFVTLLASVLSLIIFNKGVFLDPYISNNYKDNFGPYIFLAITNILIFGQDLVMFLQLENGNLGFTKNFSEATLPSWHFLFVPPAWSLALELFFYILAPFLVKRNLGQLGLLIFFGFSLKVFILFFLGWNNDPWTYRFFPIELVYFLLGIISYKCYFKMGNQSSKKQVFLGRTSFLFVIILTFLYSFIPLGNFIKQGFYLLFFLIAIPFIFQWSKRNKLDRYLGELSYPVYISHWLIMRLLSSIGLIKNETLFSIIVIMGSILVSFFLIKFITKPVEKLRQSRVETDQNIAA